MPAGSYNAISDHGLKKLKTWIGKGNSLILCRSAINWGSAKGLSSAVKKKNKETEGKEEKKEVSTNEYGSLQRDRGAKIIGGAIFESEMDLTHPLCFGYSDNTIPTFRRDRQFYEMPENEYACPVRYGESPLLSGYCHTDHLKLAPSSAIVWVNQLGGGKVINIADNLTFRGFWYGTHKIVANAIFFGHTISSAACEPIKQKQTAKKSVKE